MCAPVWWTLVEVIRLTLEAKGYQVFSAASGTEGLEKTKEIRPDLIIEVGVISLFGPHFGEQPGIAGIMFSALASVGINILAISTSISSISCLIDADDMDEALQVLEETFELP